LVSPKRWKGNTYAAHAATLRYERLAASVEGWRVSPIIERINSDLIASIKKRIGENPLVTAYAACPEASRYREEFRSYGWEHQVRLRYPRENDEPGRQGDLLVLKPHMSVQEKGVLLIQYNDAFNKFVSIYDLNRVAECYRIVLEPSTWGYSDPAILFFLNAPTNVIVQAQSAPDFQYIQSLAANLIPLRMGAGDWIDEDRFQTMPCSEKIYDIVMVASWQRIKRHELLFDAVRKCGNIVKKIALIGYPSSGRTKEDIVREARKHGVEARIDIFEGISRADVSRIIGQSKIGVMLTIREGANKGIYECIFSGVPVVISERNIGVNREHINRHTGLVAGDDDLSEKLASLLNGIHCYSPRDWALSATGYRISTRRLNDCLKDCGTRNGEQWTQDIYAKKNDTNARYVRDKDRIAADRAIAHLRGFLRN
jgi:glycosyltransferase involved in cell wall biosynthesis